MMKKNNIMKTKYIWLLLILIGFIACNDEIDVLEDQNIVTEDLPALSAGSADFSNYVALGNSLTAGFTDNALFVAAQENSMPNILSSRFALAGGGSFNQPLMNDNIGGLILGGSPVVNPVSGETLFEPRLVFDGSGPADLSSVIGPVTPTTDFLLNNPTGPFNNLGVPGAKSFHLLAPGYGNITNFPAAANPYFIRMTGSTPDASVLEMALSQTPSFFSLWIGNNDVLGYALSGGESDSMSIDFDPITPVPMFDGAYNQIIASLSGSVAGGVVANIPYVTTIPHFTTVPHNPLEPSNPDFGPQIPTLNTIFGALNQIFAQVDPSRIIIFSETENSAVVIKDESLADLSATITGALLSDLPAFEAFVGQFGLPPAAAPSVAGLLGLVYGQARQATSEDLFVLPSSKVIGTVNADNMAFLMGQGLPAALAGQFSVEGVSLPLADKWVLLPSEQDEIMMATDSFNTTIEAAATQAGLAFVDANMLMQELADGNYSSGGFEPTSALVTGGVFSLDGVHPTGRGNALIANEFLKVIDATYGSNFEASGNFVDIGEYPTNYSPLLQ